MRVRHPIEVLFGHGATLACDLDGQLRAEALHGLFVADTRVLSTYRISIAGQPWTTLRRLRMGHGTAEWVFQNTAIRDARGDLAPGSLFLNLRRRVAGGLHDDIRVSNYAMHPVRTSLLVRLDADFSDIFEVKKGSIPPRLGVGRVPGRDGVRLSYRRGGFQRGMRITLSSPTPPQMAASVALFELALDPGQDWTLCLHAEPEVDGEVVRFAGDPHEEESDAGSGGHELHLRAPDLLRLPFEQGVRDLHALAVEEREARSYLAAGVPWFYTLFGRDQLMAALMVGVLGSWTARGALASLGALQATERDDWRDAEPGKLPHELRRGELAHLGRIPHTPYYGTHDAPALYCLALWDAWRRSGDRSLLDSHLDTARAALRWCDELGDRDGDGLQEYGTRSREGYYNQGWKDARDAVAHRDGRIPALPLATVELQGYLYAARLAVAELMEEAGDEAEARELRQAAGQLRSLVEDRFWLPEEEFYAMALDGEKGAVASAGSNPGHLLWAGLPEPQRARAVARRLLAGDLFSGWGLRTLSSEHRCYNPLSYQRGSVWPHDTLIAAAGMSRYGMRKEADVLLEAVLRAALAFEDDRLPELFCGFDSSQGIPVPYVEANVPQAWAAGAPVLALQLVLGLVPDAPRGRCFLSPSLPRWLPELEVRGLPMGDGTFDVVLAREGDRTIVRELSGHGTQVLLGEVSAPLWGLPTEPR